MIDALHVDVFLALDSCTGTVNWYFMTIVCLISTYVDFSGKRLHNFEIRVGDSTKPDQNALCLHYPGIAEDGEILQLACNSPRSVFSAKSRIPRNTSQYRANLNSYFDKSLAAAL